MMDLQQRVERRRRLKLQDLTHLLSLLGRPIECVLLFLQPERDSLGRARQRCQQPFVT